MGKSSSGRSSRNESEVSSKLERRRTLDEMDSTPSRTRSTAESVTSTDHRRRSSRREDGRGDDEEDNRRSSRYSNVPQDRYTNPSTPDNRNGRDDYTRANEPDLAYRDSRRESRRESLKGSVSRGYGERNDVVSQEDNENQRRRTERRDSERSSRRRDSKRDSVTSRRSDRYEGSSRAIDDHDARLPDNQFPGSIPDSSTQPYRPPGHAADYYGDQGESVQSQPGVRPQGPDYVVNAEQSHLHAPSSESAPPPEPSSIGQVGAAASYFDSEGEPGKITTSATPVQPSRISDSQSSPKTSPGRPGRVSGRPSSASIGALGTVAAAGAGAGAGAGAAANYFSGGDMQTSSQSYSASSSHYQNSTHQNGYQGNYEGTISSGTPSKPSGSVSGSNYGAVAAAGVAGAAAAGYYMHHHHEHEHEHAHHLNAPYSANPNFSQGQNQAALMGMQQQLRHKHRGPLTKVADWFRDPYGVAQFEQYTEAIGVCRYCFDPSSSPADAPRKHYYHKTRPQAQPGRISTHRVDKPYRHSSSSSSSSSDDEVKKKKRSSVATKLVAGGLATYGAAKVGEAVLKHQNNFDDTYSVRSGQRVSVGTNRVGDDRIVYGESNVYGSGSKQSSSKARDRYESVEDIGLKRKDSSSSRKSRKEEASYDERRHSRRRDSSVSPSRMSKNAAIGLGAAGAAAGMAAIAASGRHRSRSRERSSGLNRKRSYYSKRVSPRHSYVDLSTKNTGALGFGGFFSSPSANEKKGRKKGFFTWNNDSSSSSDADLAFGEGTVRRKTSKRGKDRKDSPSRLGDTAAILGLAATGAALAAESDRRKGKSRRDTNDHTGYSSKRLASNKISLQDQETTTEVDDEGVWEDASEDESSSDSVDTALAYGGRLSNKNSRESLAEQGTSKWAWRWNKNKDKPKGRERRTTESYYQQAPQHQDTYDLVSAGMAGAAGVGAGIVAAQAAQAAKSYRYSDTHASSPLPPMQFVEPFPVSTPNLYDARRLSKFEEGPSPHTIVSRSPVPLRQPQAVTAPVIDPMPSVLNKLEADARLTDSPVDITSSTSQKEKRRQREPSTERKERKRRNSSPPLTNPSNLSRSSVTWNLTDEQLENERRAQEKQERRRRRRDDDERRYSADLSMSQQQPRDKNAAESRKESLDRHENRRAEINKELEALYAEQERKLEEQKSLDEYRRKHGEVGGIGAAIIGAGVGAAASAMVNESKKSSGSDSDKRPRRKSSLKRNSVDIPEPEVKRRESVIEDVDDEPRETKEEHDARIAAYRAGNTPSPVYDNYATYFVPKDIAESVKANNDAADKREQESTEIMLITPDMLSKRHTFNPYVYSPYRPGRIHTADYNPRGVPRLQLVEATPPLSPAVRKPASSSPLAESSTGVEDGEISDVPLDRDASSTTGSKVTWADNQTHVFEVETPEYERNDPTAEYDRVRTTKRENEYDDYSKGASDESFSVPRAEVKTDEDRPIPEIREPIREESSADPSPALEKDLNALLGGQSYQQPFYESVSDIGEVPIGDDKHRDIPKTGQGFVESLPDSPVEERKQPITSTDASNVFYEQHPISEEVVSDARPSRTERRRLERAMSSSENVTPVISKPQSPSPNVNQQEPDVPLEQTQRNLPQQMPGGFGVFDYLVDDEGRQMTPEANREIEKAAASALSKHSQESSSPEASKYSHAEDIVQPRPKRAATFDDAKADAFRSKSGADYASDPEDWERSKNKKSKNDRSSKSRSEVGFGSKDAAVAVAAGAAAAAVTAVALDEDHAKSRDSQTTSVVEPDFYASSSKDRKKRKSKRGNEVFDDLDNKSVTSLPATKEEERKSRRRSARTSEGFDDEDDVRSTISTPAEKRRSREKEKDKERDREKEKRSSGLFSGLFSSNKSDVSSTSKKSSKSTKSESRVDRDDQGDQEKRRKRRSKSSDYFEDSGSIASEPARISHHRRDSRDDNDGKFSKHAADNADADDGFVSANEDARNGTTGYNHDNEDQSFLVKGLEMPPPMVTPIPMEIDGVSGQVDTERQTSLTTNQIQEADIQNLPPLPTLTESEEAALTEIETPPATPSVERVRRLSALRITDFDSSPVALSSPTAVPLPFGRRGPFTPGGTQRATGSPSATSPSITPRTRMNRPKSSSGKDFKPLYLIERHNSTKAVTPDLEETFPSLPSSRTSSTHPSHEDLRSTAASQESPADISDERGRRYSVHSADRVERRRSPDYLGSRASTPVPGEVQRAREREMQEIRIRKAREAQTKAAFHSPSELLQDPASNREISDENVDIVRVGSPLPSVVSTDHDQEFMSAESRPNSPLQDMDASLPGTAVHEQLTHERTLSDEREATQAISLEHLPRERSLDTERRHRSRSRSTSTTRNQTAMVAGLGIAGGFLAGMATDKMLANPDKDETSRGDATNEPSNTYPDNFTSSTDFTSLMPEERLQDQQPGLTSKAVVEDHDLTLVGPDTTKQQKSDTLPMSETSPIEDRPTRSVKNASVDSNAADQSAWTTVSDSQNLPSSERQFVNAEDAQIVQPVENEWAAPNKKSKKGGKKKSKGLTATEVAPEISDIIPGDKSTETDQLPTDGPASDENGSNNDKSHSRRDTLIAAATAKIMADRTKSPARYSSNDETDTKEPDFGPPSIDRELSDAAFQAGFVPSVAQINAPDNKLGAFEEAFERAIHARGLGSDVSRDEAMQALLAKRENAPFVPKTDLTPVPEGTPTSLASPADEHGERGLDSLSKKRSKKEKRKSRKSNLSTPDATDDTVEKANLEGVQQDTTATNDTESKGLQQIENIVKGLEEDTETISEQPSLQPLELTSGSDSIKAISVDDPRMDDANDLLRTLTKEEERREESQSSPPAEAFLELQRPANPPQIPSGPSDDIKRDLAAEAPTIAKEEPARQNDQGKGRRKGKKNRSVPSWTDDLAPAAVVAGGVVAGTITAGILGGNTDEDNAKSIVAEPEAIEETLFSADAAKASGENLEEGESTEFGMPEPAFDKIIATPSKKSKKDKKKKKKQSSVAEALGEDAPFTEQAQLIEPSQITSQSKDLPETVNTGHPSLTEGSDFEQRNLPRETSMKDEEREPKAEVPREVDTVKLEATTPVADSVKEPVENDSVPPKNQIETAFSYMSRASAKPDAVINNITEVSRGTTEQESVIQTASESPNADVLGSTSEKTVSLDKPKTIAKSTPAVPPNPFAVNFSMSDAIAMSMVQTRKALAAARAPEKPKSKIGQGSGWTTWQPNPPIEEETQVPQATKDLEIHREAPTEPDTSLLQATNQQSYQTEPDEHAETGERDLGLASADLPVTRATTVTKDEDAPLTQKLDAEEFKGLPAIDERTVDFGHTGGAQLTSENVQREGSPADTTSKVEERGLQGSDFENLTTTSSATLDVDSSDIKPRELEGSPDERFAVIKPSKKSKKDKKKQKLVATQIRENEVTTRTDELEKTAESPKAAPMDPLPLSEEPISVDEVNTAPLPETATSNDTELEESWATVSEKKKDKKKKLETTSIESDLDKSVVEVKEDADSSAPIQKDVISNSVTTILNESQPEQVAIDAATAPDLTVAEDEWSAPAKTSKKDKKKKRKTTIDESDLNKNVDEAKDDVNLSASSRKENAAEDEEVLPSSIDQPNEGQSGPAVVPDFETPNDDEWTAPTKSSKKEKKKKKRKTTTDESDSNKNVLETTDEVKQEIEGEGEQSASIQKETGVVDSEFLPLVDDQPSQDQSGDAMAIDNQEVDNEDEWAVPIKIQKKDKKKKRKTTVDESDPDKHGEEAGRQLEDAPSAEEQLSQNQSDAATAPDAEATNEDDWAFTKTSKKDKKKKRKSIATNETQEPETPPTLSDSPSQIQALAETENRDEPDKDFANDLTKEAMEETISPTNQEHEEENKAAENVWSLGPKSKKDKKKKKKSGSATPVEPEPIPKDLISDTPAIESLADVTSAVASQDAVVEPVTSSLPTNSEPVQIPESVEDEWAVSTPKLSKKDKRKLKSEAKLSGSDDVLAAPKLDNATGDEVSENQAAESSTSNDVLPTSVETVSELVANKSTDLSQETGEDEWMMTPKLSKKEKKKKQKRQILDTADPESATAAVAEEDNSTDIAPVEDPSKDRQDSLVPDETTLTNDRSVDELQNPEGHQPWVPDIHDAASNFPSEPPSLNEVVSEAAITSTPHEQIPESLDKTSNENASGSIEAEPETEFGFTPAKKFKKAKKNKRKSSTSEDIETTDEAALTVAAATVIAGSSLVEDNSNDLGGSTMTSEPLEERKDIEPLEESSRPRDQEMSFESPSSVDNLGVNPIKDDDIWMETEVPEAHRDVPQGADVDMLLDDSTKPSDEDTSWMKSNKKSKKGKKAKKALTSQNSASSSVQLDEMIQEDSAQPSSTEDQTTKDVNAHSLERGASESGEVESDTAFISAVATPTETPYSEPEGFSWTSALKKGKKDKKKRKSVTWSDADTSTPATPANEAASYMPHTTFPEELVTPQTSNIVTEPDVLENPAILAEKDLPEIPTSTTDIDNSNSLQHTTSVRTDLPTPSLEKNEFSWPAPDTTTSQTILESEISKDAAVSETTTDEAEMGTSNLAIPKSVDKGSEEGSGRKISPQNEMQDRQDEGMTSSGIDWDDQALGADKYIEENVADTFPSAINAGGVIGQESPPATSNPSAEEFIESTKEATIPPLVSNQLDIEDTDLSAPLEPDQDQDQEPFSRSKKTKKEKKKKKNSQSVIDDDLNPAATIKPISLETASKDVTDEIATEQQLPPQLADAQTTSESQPKELAVNLDESQMGPVIEDEWVSDTKKSRKDKKKKKKNSQSAIDDDLKTSSHIMAAAATTEPLSLETASKDVTDEIATEQQLPPQLADAQTTSEFQPKELAVNLDESQMEPVIEDEWVSDTKKSKKDKKKKKRQSAVDEPSEISDAVVVAAVTAGALGLEATSRDDKDEVVMAATPSRFSEAETFHQTRSKELDFTPVENQEVLAAEDGWAEETEQSRTDKKIEEQVVADALPLSVDATEELPQGNGQQDGYDFDRPTTLQSSDVPGDFTPEVSRPASNDDEEPAASSKKSKKDKKKRKKQSLSEEDPAPSVENTFDEVFGVGQAVATETPSSVTDMAHMPDVDRQETKEESETKIDEWALPSKKSKKEKKNKKRKSVLDDEVDPSTSSTTPLIEPQSTERSVIEDVIMGEPEVIVERDATLDPVTPNTPAAGEAEFAIPEKEPEPIFEDEWATSTKKSKKDKKKKKQSNFEENLEQAQSLPEAKTEDAPDTNQMQWETTNDDLVLVPSLEGTGPEPAFTKGKIEETAEELWAPSKKSKKNKKNRKSVVDLAESEGGGNVIQTSLGASTQDSPAHQQSTLATVESIRGSSVTDLHEAPVHQDFLDQAHMMATNFPTTPAKSNQLHAEVKETSFETPSGVPEVTDEITRGSISNNLQASSEPMEDVSQALQQAPMAHRSPTRNTELDDIKSRQILEDFDGAQHSDTGSDVSEATRERRRRRRSPPLTREHDPEDLPRDRALTPPPDHDDIMDTALTIAAGLGFGDDQRDQSQSDPVKPETQELKNRKSAEWGFDRLDTSSKEILTRNNRDSGIQFDSPVIVHDSPGGVRDSGFVPSPPNEGGWTRGLRAEESGEARRPTRPHSPTSSTEDLQLNQRSSHFEVPVSRHDALDVTPARRQPTPVDPASKERSSVLFNSSPAGSTPNKTPRSGKKAQPDARDQIISGTQSHHSRGQGSLEGISDSPSVKRKPKDLASALVDRSPTSEANVTSFTPSPRQSTERQISPSRIPLDTIHESSTSPATMAAIGAAALGAGAFVAGSRDRDNPSRSLGTSKTRTGSQRSLRGSETSLDQHDPSQTGVGVSTTRGMSENDYYDGFGSHPGSPMSPTRPPSVRKRQSMQQIRDLEARVDQLAQENRSLAEAKLAAEKHLEEFQTLGVSRSSADDEALQSAHDQLQQRDNEISKLRAEITTLAATHATLKASHDEKHDQFEQSTRELQGLRSQHEELSSGMEDIVKHEIAAALAVKESELQRLRHELENARLKIKELQSQILARGADDIIIVRDEDYFEIACQNLCQHVQGWVVRFSKFSDTRVCRTTNEVREEKIVDRFDNALLDGSDVDAYLSDRVKRRDVFMSVVMTLIWEYVFTRYLFGMDREQRQKLKQLEKNLAEVGPANAVHQWRALTLTLLSKRESFRDQCERDTEAVVVEIVSTLSRFLPPPQNLEAQIYESLKKVMNIAVQLSIEMRTQKAEYIMLPPLTPEYDTNGDLVQKFHFNANLMNERSGEFSSNDELEDRKAVVRIVLFPLVMKKGDDNGQGDEEIVVCPAQVLVVRADRGKRPRSRIASGGSDARSLRAASTHSLAMSGVDVTGSGNMI